MCVRDENCLHVLCFFPFNLICNMTIFIKKKIVFTSDPTSGVNGVRMGNLLTLHVSLHLIPLNFMQHDHILKMYNKFTTVAVRLSRQL